MIEYGRRRRHLPAPPHVVHADLVAPVRTGSRVWLALLDDEVPPQVVEAEAPTRVVWSSLWPSRPGDLVVFELAPEGGQTALTVTLLTDGDPPDADTIDHVRRRMSHLLFADLRLSYGQ